MREKIGFWSEHEGPYKCFSNFFPCVFYFQDRKFCCSEQAFMWMKARTFNDEETAAEILKETIPYKIKKLGRKVKNYKEEVWNEIRYDIMFQVNKEKYFYNQDLRQILLDTEDAYLFEDSPYDYIWGIGKNGGGQNLLGKVLMEIRDYFKSDAFIMKKTTENN